ncbi:Ff.00g049520.m01.CDS01 [Fusarium sp. VM40]|nr:Ff.00g049520.m01.CDS01 [Fusarium sp. VM40]
MKENRPPKASRFSIPHILQLDRLLTLSCNARGVKSLLTSVFFEPDVPCNMCGLWLRGSFSYLSSIKDPHILLRILTNRDSDLGFLWFGAFITGAYHKSLREGRAGWWIIDLAAAAWTGTTMSFIQTPVPRLEPWTKSISRADECRLLFLCHDVNYTIPPLFPFPPFGSSSMSDANLEVREHSICGKDHGLKYAYFTWVRTEGAKIRQEPETPVITIRPKCEPTSTHSQELEIDYDDCDSEDETSEMVTRNMFTWLRGEDGFPVAERAIREHEWIDNLDSDDDSPIEGDVHSTFGGNLHGWLLKTSTQRSNSI